MLSVFVRAKGLYGKGELGKCWGCFRIGGSEFALIERNVPPWVHLYSLSFVLYSLIYWDESKCRYIFERFIFF